MRKLFYCIFLFTHSLLAAEEIIVDLRNPVYQNGALSTNEGGVVTGEDLRIQAQKILYVRQGESVHQIEAEGDLMIQYKGRVYVGKRLEFDFKKKSGTVFEAKTFAKMWYLGSKEIHLKPDGSYEAKHVTITTCENTDSSWDLHSSKVDVLKNDLMSAKKVQFRFFRIPFLWLPSFKISLKKFKEPVFHYSLRWDKGPRAMARYQIYSWQDFALYGRLQYRWGKGWGGALETEYFPEGSPTTFVTRSYVATDRLDNAYNIAKRYRVQGNYRTASEDGRTKASLSWDKYSDVRMPDDFKTEDFEVNPSKITQLCIKHQTPDWMSYFKVRPRLNPFESIQQDLPSLYTVAKPIPLGTSHVISANWMRLSYLNFVYSNQLAIPPGRDPLQDFRSARLELRPKLYRAFPIGPLTFTPQIGAIGIFYSNSPSHEVKNLGVLQYGAKLNARGQRSFTNYQHIIEPYIEYIGLSTPTVPPDQHYIFSIQDGFQQLNQIKTGIRQVFWSHWRQTSEPSLTADLYANAFFNDPVIQPFVYKLYCNLSWKLPSLHLSFLNTWNFQNQVWDESNMRLKWTVSEHVAFTLETRYRSKYNWRKADHENFILDVTRPYDELLSSPLSDRRITILTKCFLRLTPFWECQFASHHGFYRLNQTAYNEFNIDVFTWLSSHWKLRLSYRLTEKHPRNHFDLGLNLVK